MSDIPHGFGPHGLGPHGFGPSALALNANAGAVRLRRERPVADRAPATARPAEIVPLVRPPRVGVISNPRSHRNKVQHGAQLGDIGDARHAQPRTPAELAQALAGFAAEGVDLLAVDGGDGTVRDVITAAATIFPGRFPRMAVIPSGKTNALALDLGIPADATLERVLAGARAGRFVERPPIEIARRDATAGAVRGFLFGAGAFVRSTELAQRTHGWGAFNSLAVGLSVGWGIAQTIFAAPGNAWKAGDRTRIAVDGGTATERMLYIVFGSTLTTLPLGLKPLGRPREGMKILIVDAPPKRIVRNAARLLAGSEAPGLARDGYHHIDAASLELTLDGGFILDGELYAGGDLSIRRGAPIQFAVP